MERNNEEDFKNLKRYSFTLPPDLVDKIDEGAERLDMNRSQVVREALTHWMHHAIDSQLVSGVGVAVINYCYNHHDARVLRELMRLQHEFEAEITSSTHIHLSEKTCLEIVICNGELKRIQDLANKLRSIKSIYSFSTSFSQNN